MLYKVLDDRISDELVTDLLDYERTRDYRLAAVGKEHMSEVNSHIRNVLHSTVRDHGLCSRLVKSYTYGISQFLPNATEVHIETPQILRYGPGCFYRAHVDNNGSDYAWRRVSSITMLSEASQYTGGELIIMEPGKDTASIRLDKGQTVLFDSTVPHKVLPVKSGIRYAIVTWMSDSAADRLVKVEL